MRRVVVSSVVDRPPCAAPSTWGEPTAIPRGALFDVRRTMHVEVVGDGVTNERLQHRVVEHLEPGNVGERLRLRRRRDEPVFRRGWKLGPLVIRADGASRQQAGCGQGEETGTSGARRHQ
jgi:hypothetical protein